MSESPSYEIEGRELIAETEGLRVQELTVGPGGCVPWHHHTVITDTFFCLEGPMLVETRGPDVVHRLRAGERAVVPPRVAHTVRAAEGGRCRFVLVQGVGEYDYRPGLG